MGEDRNGGGAFAIDPWEAYNNQLISGMSMILFGQVGTGKSHCAKSFATRSVKAGRRLSVASDKKGEWTPVVRALGGSVIRVGPGMPDRINPLDAGTRPRLNALGKPLGDAEWQLRVRIRRLAILNTMVKILVNRDISPGETHAVSVALDDAVESAARAERAVILPDVINELENLKTHDPDSLVREGAAIVKLVLHRLTSGAVCGVVDGATSVGDEHGGSVVCVY